MTDSPDSRLRGAAPAVLPLSNGRLTSFVGECGTGGASLGALALTRWVPDATRDADASVLYVRDLDDGAWWSAGTQPARRPPARHEVRFAPGVATLVREDEAIVTTLEVCVAPDGDVELRRLGLENRGSRARRLEVTTYAELVLNTPAADAAHPAFSKLFVQTELDAGRQALLARRRLRSPEDEPLWVAHRLVGEAPGRHSYETDRARFLGRGRDTRAPRALDEDGELSGTVGNVLDPVVSIRREVSVPAGGRVTLLALLAAAPTREHVLALVDGVADAGAAEAAFAGARRRATALLSELRIDEAALGPDVPHSLTRAVGAVLHAHLPAPDATAWRSALDDRALFTVARDVAARLPQPRVAPRATAAYRPAMQAGGGVTRDEETLRFFNGHGGFSHDGREYVVRLSRDARGLHRPPLPWVNVIANERAGCIVSETGAGYTWSGNSRENRLTPWHNDPVADPHGEAMWIRDRDAAEFWSPTGGPTAPPGAVEARHGFGYTTWRHESRELLQEVLAFVPRSDPLRVVRVRITNRASRRRRLDVFSYAHWVLGVHPWETARHVVTRAHGRSIRAVNAAAGEFAPLVAFAAVVGESADVSCTADRASFLGARGTLAAPAALASDAALDGVAGTHLDPCAAFRVTIDVGPGATTEVAFLLGQGRDDAEVDGLLSRYGSVPAVEAALAEARAHWRSFLDSVQVETPSPELDLMVNGWLAYQNLSCRIWGRSAYYQSGGAYGFRDQLQDAASLVLHDPALTRRQIVLHASHQFPEGDVLHWWHPPLSKGIRTRFADDLLWLPFVTGAYVATTGDASVLDERARFVAARQLEPGEDEAFVFPTTAATDADVYEHCCLTIERSLPTGAHGLPLMGTGDWNDGMNRVGREGRGESVWLGFFLAHTMERFLPLVDARGDHARAARWREHLERLAVALNTGGWDGEWYRRAYYDDGAPLGAATNDECRIDAIAQAWAVISGVAPAARAEQALDAMERHLVSEREGIIRLLTPAFDRTPHDPGYIKGYLPGVRENGGQYTHGTLWAVKALAQLGRSERAARLLAMLSPVSHGRTPEEVETYRVEPYVIAADVYGVAPHVGRGGWTWYTGSAGWMLRIALESILGVELVGGTTLRLRPCIPAAWPGFRLTWRMPEGQATLELDVSRTDGPSVAQFVDGGEVSASDGALELPLPRGGGRHRVLVALGPDVGPRYEPRLAPGAPAARA